ncbi:MAG TPA: formate--tetrahydrofolate ligase, partial [bacterium]|nr:formate--tetrahydrofolate ligase [bacterium]
MKTDIEIAREAEIKPVKKLAKEWGIEENELFEYGKKFAKVELSILDRLKKSPNGKYINVTAVNPTLGEGKTTTTVGLGMSLNK